MGKNDRFVKVHEEGVLAGRTIYVDRETRVQYLFASAGHAGGMAVLVDKDGKPLLYRGNFDE